MDEGDGRLAPLLGYATAHTRQTVKSIREDSKLNFAFDPFVATHLAGPGSAVLENFHRSETYVSPGRWEQQDLRQRKNISKC